MKLDNNGNIVWPLASHELEQLKLVALGCHQSCFEAVERTFRESGSGVASWALNDYFLLQPLPRELASKHLDPPPGGDFTSRDGAVWNQAGMVSPALYYPYFERRLRAQAFLPKVASGLGNDAERRDFYQALLKKPGEAIEHVLSWPLMPNTGTVSNALRQDLTPDFVSFLPDETNGMSLIRNWAHHAVVPDGAGVQPTNWDNAVFKRYTAWGIVEGILNDLMPPDAKTAETDTKLQAAKRKKDMAAARVELAVNDFPWLLQARANVNGPITALPEADIKRLQDLPVMDAVSVGILSEDHFYGYLVVSYPPALADSERLRQQLLMLLQRETRTRYRDVLTLFFNRVHEERLSVALKEQQLPASKEEPQQQKAPASKDGQEAPPSTDEKEFPDPDLIIDHCPFDGVRPKPVQKGSQPPKRERPPVTVEHWLRWLWRERHDLWASAVGHIQTELKRRDKGAAPAAQHLLDVKRELAKTLVLAKMQIASPPMVGVIRKLMNFRVSFDPTAANLPSVLVIGGPGSGKDNMARLVPLFAQGYTFGGIHTINMAAIRPQFFVGPLLQGLNFGATPVESVFPVVKANETQHVGETVILDELNSLDVDQQGILLRVLENSEVTPLFSRDSRRANFLCVGVMNEEPEDLMKEDELRVTSARSQLFGKLLGTVVDDMFRRARRLRPDLFYRMQRYGIVRLPNLNQRRADIPILFRAFLPKHDRSNRKIEYDIELAAFERLMERDLAWPGNVRELQAITRMVYQKAEAGADEQLEAESFRVRVTRSHVDEVLHQQARTTGADGGSDALEEFAD